MGTISHYADVTSVSEGKVRSSLWTNFMNWCKGQEGYRLLWVAVALSVHGCALTPLVLAIILLTGFHFGLIILSLAAMGIAVITNLAAMPTRITIPVFFLSVLIDLGIIIAAIGYAISGN